MAAAETSRISQVGLAARSPEGHAAKGGMAIKGNEDMWVHIQANTFRNWVNEHLKTVGLAVMDLASDFSDGTKLVALVEVLQKRPLRHIRRPANPHQFLENVTTALNAVAEDGVKLVNIGNVDIVNGNLKLILGLIWSLIVRYQIGRSKFPPRKLMLAWLKAVLPECQVHNFTTDWNSGVYLSALLDYCKPGLFPHWRSLDSHDAVNNCRRAMELAQREFQIPKVLEPEYLASPHLDELSGMTYLSYFMKEDSPGFHATLRWVNSQLPNTRVSNFTRDWNSGLVLCELVHSLGGPVANLRKLSPDDGENNLGLGIRGGQRLGVEPILRAKDMADQNVEHLGVMAYAAHFQWVRARNQPSERLAAHWTQHTCRVHKAAQFKVECLEENVEASEVRAEVVGPSGRVESRFNMTSGGGQGSCTPTEVGMYQLLVYCEGELIQGCPTSLRVMPEVTSISYPGMEPCAIGSIVEVLVNSYGARNGQVEVMAHSPTGRNLECPVQERDGVYTANFQPDEAGEWQIHVLHGGQNVQGGPYTCFVFDPNGVRLEGLEGATPGRQHSFICDTSATGGLGDVVLDIALSGRSVQHQVDEIGPHRYKVSFLPAQPGKYKVYVYFNGQEVRGSAFSMRIGSYRSTKQHSKQATHHSSSFSEQNRSSSFARAGRDSPDRINRDQLTKEMSRVTMNSRLTQEERHTPPAVNPSDIYAVSTKKLTAPAKVTSTLTTHLRAVSPVRSPSPARFNPSPITYSATVKHSDSFSNDYTSVTESRFQQHSSFTSGSRLLNSGGSPPQLLNGSAHLLRATPSPKPLPGQVDTSSNVRVSSMLNNLNQRRDSWDAIAKTKSLLSYGSLESVANVHNTENHVHSTYTSRPSGYTLSTASPTVESTEPRLVAVHRQASVLVPSQGLDAGDLSAYVSGPYLSSVPCSVTPRPPHHLAVNFVPKDIGEHVVELRNGDHRVAGSPIK
ncbi:Hypothetical predicted protein [Cloeon dipterum]|uniref:Calponin-homology (CH) domain-containing protein n=1 Tax=Cloeon dipterum TaxID=197152 RepID=A0A8S1DA03_9INSE|nr:Hypothetical predicted protein [Cloeon dipterum]